MNGPVMRWLLDLDTIPEDATGLRLAWEHPLPTWTWALLVVGAIALSVWSYRRLSGSRALRIGLSGVRTIVLLLACILVSGPMIELPRETVEPDWVLVLADRSASMAIEDAGAGTTRQSRDEALRAVIDDNAETWATLARTREVRWLGFHSGAFALDGAPGADDGTSLTPATGERTDIDAAISQALQRAAARPISGIVLLTDGRTTSSPGRPTMRRLESDRIPVFPVPLGSPEARGDLALARVDAPQRAFVRDKVPVVVEIDRLGALRDLGGRVTLVDEFTGEELDAIELAAGDTRDQLTLTAEPELAGEANWRVSIETTEPDLVPENNSRPFVIELVDRPLRVLYVDGYPRWEYRYLKNLLVRESSIDCSVMLLSADRDFAQEGNQPITRLPRSPEEFARYDVVLMGDVPGSFFSPDQLEMLKEHIADRGAGLLWIGGARSTPATYAGTVMTDLLPMRGRLQLPLLEQPVTLRPTEFARQLGVLRLVTSGSVGWPDALSDPAYGWSQLYGVQRIEPGRLKPTAEVLAETVATFDGTPLPVVVHMRYGAGQTIYCATDEIWRWRYGRGEMLPDQFWIQMVRMLGRASLTTGDDPAVLVASPRRLEIGQPLRIDLRLLDAGLVDPRRRTVPVAVEDETGSIVTELELQRLPETEDRYGTTWLPDVTGALRIVVRDQTLGDTTLTASVDVFAPDDELRHPETDHPLLEEIAVATGGRTLTASSIQSLPKLLPNRAVRTRNPLRERIWDTPLFFVLILLALSVEWVGRKVLRLS